MTEKDEAPRQTAQVTGHVWDGDIRQYDNPLPRWWLRSFLGTVLFAVIYWIFFPAWPVADGYTKGLLNEITYVDSEGREQTTHWNTRARLLRDLQQDEAAATRRDYLNKIEQTAYSVILQDAELMDFARSQARALFGDNCAPCHGAGGAGVIGSFPNLADDDWLWGGGVREIEQTIGEGRTGFMPAFRGALDDGQIEDVAAYVLSLSGHVFDQNRIIRGRKIFLTSTGGCYYCHTPAGTGLKSQGAANLTDAIWTVADVLDARTPGAELAAVKRIIRDGVHREMPGWSSRLTPAQIKLLTVYVHELRAGRAVAHQ
jgi:cytochrome c oxidase cbb3-type subunit 3